MSWAEIAAVPSACAPAGEGQRSCSPRKSSMQRADMFVEDKLRSNAVTLFVKAGCPYCQNAQELLQRYTSSFGTPDVIKIDGQEEVQACLQRRTGQRTEKDEQEP
ncbi:glutaredoxin-1-like isoform X2 [Mycteria americana]|uniref:glutaredoxin-1-like isoform X2 n=1 Tax=Mycteria americana TaxID=33587 RepID=UPI003F587D7A